MKERRSRTPSILTAIAFALIAAPNVARAEHIFRFPADPIVLTRSLAGTVRIFSSETDGDQLGSGFVVDSGEGLILTAAHVLAGLGGPAWVAFPRENTRHRVEIIASKPSGFDLAILKFDPKVDDADSLEVQFEPISAGQDHQVTGYGRSNSDPQQQTVKPSYSSNCTYTLRGAILYGDSGSPLLTVEGLVDGIAIDGAESGGGGSMSEMKVLPLSCLMSQILDIVPDHQNSKIMSIMAKGNERSIRRAFQPPPKPGWVSNLRLAKAIQGWITNQARPKMDRNHLMTATDVIIDRHLGTDMVVDLCKVASATPKDGGDALRKFADAAASQGLTAAAQRAYAEATSLYVQYAAMYVPEGGAEQIPKRPEVATVYKEIADTLVARGLISGKEDDFDTATSFAAGAVLYSPNKSKLKASSWATLGSASQEAGEASVAVPAFRAAIGEGASESWITKDLLKAKSALGQQPQTNLTAAYLGERAHKADQMIMMHND
jgi:Trypsin-like peptidase domain